MIVQDFNRMTLEELMAIHELLKMNYVIEDGRILSAEKEEDR